MGTGHYWAALVAIVEGEGTEKTIENGGDHRRGGRGKLWGPTPTWPLPSPSTTSSSSFWLGDWAHFCNSDWRVDYDTAMIVILPSLSGALWWLWDTCIKRDWTGAITYERPQLSRQGWHSQIGRMCSPIKGQEGGGFGDQQGGGGGAWRDYQGTVCCSSARVSHSI